MYGFYSKLLQAARPDPLGADSERAREIDSMPFDLVDRSAKVCPNDNNDAVRSAGYNKWLDRLVFLNMDTYKEVRSVFYYRS